VRQALAARSDRDFTRANRAEGPGSWLASAGGRLLAAALKRPGSLLGGLVLTASSLAIVVNALSLQQSRHPSPMFSRAERATPPARPVDPAPIALAPTPPSRPLPVAPPAAASAAAPPQPPARSQARDPIGDMIKASETTGSSGSARTGDGEQRLVTSAQRALLKLGYGPLKADGMLGQGTRQAIERFERDRRLPVTGDLGQRTARALSAQSGVRLD
jgi:hypothetical protein